jgi:ADP-ribosyl-[dinitrogen reductase] hydrolase
MDLNPSENQVLGGLYGVLVGDALGVPYEFTNAEDLPPAAQIEMAPPPGFRRAHSAASFGAWSDDGAQALCLLASLLYRKKVDIDDLARRLINWYEHGYMAVDYLVFDVGIQTSRALSAIKGGTPVEHAAPASERNNGNGSLMRALPLALWHTGTDEQLVVDAMLQSLPTHAHLRSQLCCALYCLWARMTLLGNCEPWADAVRALRQMSRNNPAWESELDLQIQPDRPAGGNGTGYVVDCLHSARLALEEPTFERAVKRAIAFGEDTDTTAAVAGGIAGIRFGLAGIPERWISALPCRSTLIEPLAQELVAHLAMDSDRSGTT